MSEQTDSVNSIIKTLPPELANKIAAGEVIQRPASVVKELLDNAIDSGAESIKVIIQNAGRTLIQVIDDGCGMGKDDLRRCFMQHATSKIRQIDDLFKIRTLGFRGEAMASIASISQVELKTKRIEDEAGYLVENHGGEVKRLEPAAVDNGTSVAVRNLFYNVPARRQFLKTDATEFRHILKAVHAAALAHTDIAFELTADTDRIYNLPASGLKERVAEIFGRQYRSSLISFEEKTSYVTVSGLLGDPNITKRNRGEQFVFVNGRPVQHRYLTHVLLSTYENLIGDREYPFFALYLDMDVSQVDVNVHPAKLEVKFDDERSVIQLTRSVVKKALNEYLMVPQVHAPSGRARGDFDTSFRKLSGFGGEEDVRGSWIENKGSETGPAEGEMQIPSRINFDRRKNFDGIEISRQLYEGIHPLSSGQGEQKPDVTPE
ncbi:MAG: DNA mismatch repair endonuclease MutL, partial [Balneolaceae bacterium]